MPRPVDHDSRRRAIVRATVEVLATRGLSGLTLRAVAEQLGGSLTLVTHYYNSREELIGDLATQLTAEWGEDVAKLDQGLPDPLDRINALLIWALPEGPEEMLIERARIELLASRGEFPDAGRAFAGWNAYMRELFREHLHGLVPPENIETTVDLLRAIITGITMEAYQHDWSRARQLRVLNDALTALGLAPRTRSPRKTRAEAKPKTVGRSKPSRTSA